MSRRRQQYSPQPQQQLLQLQPEQTQQAHQSNPSHPSHSSHQPLQALQAQSRNSSVMDMPIPGRISDLIARIQPTPRTGPWDEAEDEVLLYFVDGGHNKNWVRIAGRMRFRTAKQCRERYFQSLRPGISHAACTADEAKTILDMVATIGTRWADIARHLGNRSDNWVKNWWNGQKNERIKAKPTTPSSSSSLSSSSSTASLSPARSRARARARDARAASPSAQSIRKVPQLALPTPPHRAISFSPAPLSSRPHLGDQNNHADSHHHQRSCSAEDLVAAARYVEETTREFRLYQPHPSYSVLPPPTEAYRTAYGLASNRDRDYFYRLHPVAHGRGQATQQELHQEQYQYHQYDHHQRRPSAICVSVRAPLSPRSGKSSPCSTIDTDSPGGYTWSSVSQPLQHASPDHKQLLQPYKKDSYGGSKNELPPLTDMMRSLSDRHRQRTFYSGDEKIVVAATAAPERRAPMSVAHLLND